jgi:hypothetical protein
MTPLIASATGCAGGRPLAIASSASRHHCSRIRPAIGWLTWWWTLPISWSKA